MSIGPHVFGDYRLGLYMMANASFTDKLRHRLPLIRDFCNGAVTDIFLPESATAADKDLCRKPEHTFFVSAWTTPANRGPIRYAQESLAALDRIGAGALELNIEVQDLTGGGRLGLEDYTRAAVGEIRKTRKALRLRVNIAPFKAGFMPVDLFLNDPNLYLIEQAYFGNMDGRASEADVLLNMFEAGIPAAKCSVMYGAANYDPYDPRPIFRERTMPALTIRRLRRGSIYQDDLMADVGLL